MIDQALINQWWSSIQSMEVSMLEENASSLCHMHNSERILGLQPLPGLQFPDVRSTGLLSRKPAFKNLELQEILFLRKCLLTKQNSPELSNWAEALLRYLEINRSSIIKKADSQYGSEHSRRIVLLELTAFMLDAFFEWDDLRFLNLGLKLMDMPGIFSMNSISKKITGQNKKLPLLLVQVRLMILRQAAIEKIKKS